MEFSLTNQTVQNFDGDCSVLFAFSDKSNDDQAIQALIDLNHFKAKVEKNSALILLMVLRSVGLL